MTNRLLAAVGVSLLALACGRLVKSDRPPPQRVAPDHESGGLAKLSRGETSYAPKAQTLVWDAGPPEDPSQSLAYGDYTFEHDGDYRPAPYPYEGYKVRSPLGPTGTISGRVTWPGAPTIETDKPGARCPDLATDRILSLGEGHSVRGAVVYLDDIEHGRPLLGRMQSGYADRHFQIGGVLEWQTCRVEPYVQLVAPVGAVLTATSRDPIELDMVRVHGKAREVADHIALPGSGATVERTLHRAGFYRIERSPADPLASLGWIAVARHPYYALTDGDGRFSLEQVPPGRYTLVAWHPPVATTGGPQPVAPVTIRRPITVGANRNTSVQLRLSAH